MLVLMVVYSVCVGTSLGHLVAFQDQEGPRRRNMGVVTVTSGRARNSPSPFCWWTFKMYANGNGKVRTSH